MPLALAEEACGHNVYAADQQVGVDDAVVQLQSGLNISMLRSSASDRHVPRCTDHFSADNAAYWYGKHPQRTPAADTCCAGINRAYYGRIERGEHSLTVEKCQMIATALGVRIADLFTELPE